MGLTRTTRQNMKGFAKGHDPRRHVGAPSMGRQITSYMNYLSEEDEDGNARFTEADLQAIIRDPKSSHPKVIAAQDILRARMDGFERPLPQRDGREVQPLQGEAREVQVDHVADGTALGPSRGFGSVARRGRGLRTLRAARACVEDQFRHFHRRMRVVPRWHGHIRGWSTRIYGPPAFLKTTGESGIFTNGQIPLRGGVD